ncbi:MAG: N-acetylneuraminate synthase [Desulfuromonadales bacterium]|nr:N-acetylneuraminate synthase [Desulfuromonadales bacterium]
MQSVFIIAEAGVNHNGDLQLAKQLVDVAAEAGADAVKFQTFKAESLVSQGAPKAAYQQQTTAADESQFAMIKKLELDLSAHRLLISHCQQRNIMFLSSPFDLESIDLLFELGMEIFKIPSGEITNLPYLRKIGTLNKEVILSTGMSTMKEIEAAIQILYAAGLKKTQLTILHCNTEYPTPMTDVNLHAMQTLADSFGIEAGYSDHTLGVEIPIAAVALGARVIEKHITLDNNLPGPDHRASLEPKELAEMISAIRNLEQALGDGIKKPTPSEEKNRPIARKSIIASRKIKKGELLTEDNLTVKRPATGISPMEWDRLVGTRASKDFQADEAITL